MPLTVLAVADEVDRRLYDHFDGERWRDVDLVLSAGDVPPYYLDFLASSLNVPVIYVRGNHDGTHATSDYQGAINAHGKIVCCGGLRIAGFEGCMRYNHGPVQYTEREMGRVVWSCRLHALWQGRPDVVLSHAPPAGIHDGPDLCHTGFGCFLTAIRAWRPSFFFHGHVHKYERGDVISTSGPTTVVNAYPHQVVQIPLRSERSRAVVASH